MYPHLGGFESTHIFGTGQDNLGSTRHIDHWLDDLARLLSIGVQTLRYSAPWHRIETHCGLYDWSWFDKPMEFMRTHNMVPILDPLHHTSFPSWLSGGFLHPEFPALYVRFLRKLCERYPWVDTYTVFNEPLATTLFCSYTGMWYPHLKSDLIFVEMAMQVGRAICDGCACLREMTSPVFIHVETCEHHSAGSSEELTGERLRTWVGFVNGRRFLLTDLVLGRITRNHELYPYLTKYGATEAQLAWFEEHRARIDILGLDYYWHSEMEWNWPRGAEQPGMTAQSSTRRGFASVARDYVLRYGLPIMLSETNWVGTVADRIGWLKRMEAECENLVRSGVDFRAFCWYPSIDTTDWHNGCTQYTGQIDPQGIWWLCPGTLQRMDSELSDVYGRLARGEISSADLPDYIAVPANA